MVVLSVSLSIPIATSAPKSASLSAPASTPPPELTSAATSYSTPLSTSAPTSHNTFKPTSMHSHTTPASSSTTQNTSMSIRIKQRLIYTPPIYDWTEKETPPERYPIGGGFVAAHLHGRAIFWGGKQTQQRQLSTWYYFLVEYVYATLSSFCFISL